MPRKKGIKSLTPIYYGQNIYLKNLSENKKSQSLWGRGYGTSDVGSWILTSTCPASPNKYSRSSPSNPRKDCTASRVRQLLLSCLGLKCSSSTFSLRSMSQSASMMVDDLLCRNAHPLISKIRDFLMLFLVCSLPKLRV